MDFEVATVLGQVPNRTAAVLCEEGGRPKEATKHGSALWDQRGSWRVGRIDMAMWLMFFWM